MCEDREGEDQIEFLIVDWQIRRCPLRLRELARQSCLSTQIERLVPCVDAPYAGWVAVVVHHAQDTAVATPAVEDVRACQRLLGISGEVVFELTGKRTGLPK